MCGVADLSEERYGGRPVDRQQGQLFMFAIRAQYFLTYCVMGAVLPYLAVYLADSGLSATQIGQIFMVQGVAVIITPPLITLLADLHVEPRRLLGMLAMTAAGSLIALALAGDFWELFAAYAVFALAFSAMPATQDGLLFAFQNGQERRGEPPLAYHRVRVWGTVGFIVPSLLLYALLVPADVKLVGSISGGGLTTASAMWTGAALASVGALATALLPTVHGTLAGREHVATSRPPERRRDRINSWPTVAAIRVLMHPQLLVFCAAIFILHLTAAAYYQVYPQYCVDPPVGIARQWVGLISSLGVALEVGYVLAFAVIARGFSLHGIFVIGALAMAVRYALLAWEPTVGVAVGTQLLHGLMVLCLLVATPVFLAESTKRIDARCTASIHGVFQMLVVGAARLIGNPLAGYLAEGSKLRMFWWCAVGSGVAAVMLVGLLLMSQREKSAVSPTAVGVRD